MKELNKQIQNLEVEINIQEIIRHRIQEIHSKLLALSDQIESHKIILHKELQDVEALESLSVKSLFVRFIGDLESRLDKERQEYLHAYLRHKAMIEEYHLLEKELITVRRKKESITTKRKELKVLKQRKSVKLKKVSSIYFRAITQIDKEIAVLNTALQRCTTAIKSGKTAITVLDKILRDLKQTIKWGHAYHGRGRYSSMKKKSYIDKARKNVTLAKVAIDKYEILVERIFVDVNVKLSLESFEHFVDDFLDNLITDWIIQKKIKNALQCLEMNVDKIIRHNYALDHEIHKLKDKISLLNRKKEEQIDQF